MPISCIVYGYFCPTMADLSIYNRHLSPESLYERGVLKPGLGYLIAIRIMYSKILVA